MRRRIVIRYRERWTGRVFRDSGALERFDSIESRALARLFLRGTEVLPKMFSDTIYGGKEAARRAARKFKRTAVRSLAKRRLGGFRSATRRHRSKSSRKRGR